VYARIDRHAGGEHDVQFPATFIHYCRPCAIAFSMSGRCSCI
jgi:hypothetical protein